MFALALSFPSAVFRDFYFHDLFSDVLYQVPCAWQQARGNQVSGSPFGRMTFAGVLVYRNGKRIKDEKYFLADVEIHWQSSQLVCIPFLLKSAVYR